MKKKNYDLYSIGIFKHRYFWKFETAIFIFKFKEKNISQRSVYNNSKSPKESTREAGVAFLNE